MAAARAFEVHGTPHTLGAAVAALDLRQEVAAVPEGVVRVVPIAPFQQQVALADDDVLLVGGRAHVVDRCCALPLRLGLAALALLEKEKRMIMEEQRRQDMMRLTGAAGKDRDMDVS